MRNRLLQSGIALSIETRCSEGLLATQIYSSFISWMYRWFDSSELPWFLATSRFKVFLKTALEVSQQYGEHMTKPPGD